MQELNGLEEGKASMTDEEGEGVGGEGEAGTAGWSESESGPKKQTYCKRREEHDATHTCRSVIGAHTA